MSFFTKKSTEEQKRGLAAIESLAVSLADIAQSLEVLKSLEPKINTIYEAYRELNQPK